MQLVDSRTERDDIVYNDSISLETEIDTTVLNLTISSEVEGEVARFPQCYYSPMILKNHTGTKKDLLE